MPPYCTVCFHDSDSLLSLGERVVFRCPQCGHSFQPPSGHETTRHDDAGNASHGSSLPPNRQSLFESVAREIELRASESARIAQLSCGESAFLKFLRKRLPNATLFEISDRMREEIAGVTYLQIDTRNLPHANGIDVIVGFDILDTFHGDVHAVLRQTKALLAPSGFFFLTASNDRSLLAGLSRVLWRKGFPLVASKIYVKQQLNYFSQASLQTLLRHHGFLPLSVFQFCQARNSANSNDTAPKTLNAIFWLIDALGQQLGKGGLLLVSAQAPTSQQELTADKSILAPQLLSVR